MTIIQQINWSYQRRARSKIPRPQSIINSRSRALSTADGDGYTLQYLNPSRAHDAPYPQQLTSVWILLIFIIHYRNDLTNACIAVQTVLKVISTCRRVILPKGIGRTYMLGVGKQYNTIVVSARGRQLVALHEFEGHLRQAASEISHHCKIRFKVDRRATLDFREL